jgi:hypothetical protein
MSKYIIWKQKAYDIIQSFPKTKIWNPYLTLKNWKKCFFTIFIKKYWLDWSNCKYSNLDIYRRIKWVESFDCLLKRYEICEEDENTLIIETIFFRFVIKKYRFRKWSMRLELLSFYDK